MAVLTALILALSMSLAGCAGREARPVASTNPSDSAFDCAGIAREFEANERQISSTVKERTDAQGKNIVLGATGVLLFLPALFFMDLGRWTRKGRADHRMDQGPRAKGRER